MILEEILFATIQAAWALAIQLVVGRILVAFLFAGVLLSGPRNRRRWTRWLGASRRMQQALFPALGGAVGIAVLFHLIPLPRLPQIEPFRILVPGLTTLLGAAATAGLWLMLLAGRLESAGRLRPARRLVRPAGMLVAAGCGLLSLGWAAEILASAVTLRSAAPLAGWGAAAVLGLLSGLSGKPRPGDKLATTGHVVALIAAISAIWP